MEDESIQQVVIEEVIGEEAIESNDTPEINNLELNESGSESVEYFQKSQGIDEMVDLKTFSQENIISNTLEKNINNEEIYVNVKNENVSLKIQPQGNTRNKIS